MSDTTLILFLIVFLPAAVLLNPYLEKNSKKKIFKSLGVSLVLLIIVLCLCINIWRGLNIL